MSSLNKESVSVIACKRDMVTAAFDFGYDVATVAAAMNEPEQDIRRAFRLHNRFNLTDRGKNHDPSIQ